MRVLVVEDQAELADDIADGLRDQGIGADVAYDGSAAIEKALLNAYDVVVLDRDLPRIHGDAVCATLVGSPSQARILMLTAAGTVDDRVDGLNLGADDYLAKPNRTAAQLEDMATRVRRSIDRAEAMIEALLVLAISDQASQQGSAGRELLDLSAVAEDALELAAPAVARLGLTVRAKLAPAQVIGDQPLIERMVWNLVDNAVKHNQPGGWITVATGRVNENSFLSIANSGAPVPADAVPTLSEPFRRLGPKTEGGFGLGLSIARSVSAAHGAVLDVRSQPEGGLSIRVVL
jgi:signal transduction histidine kinase